MAKVIKKKVSIVKKPKVIKKKTAQPEKSESENTPVAAKKKKAVAKKAAQAPKPKAKAKSKAKTKKKSASKLKPGEKDKGGRPPHSSVPGYEPPFPGETPQQANARGQRNFRRRLKMFKLRRLDIFMPEAMPREILDKFLQKQIDKYCPKIKGERFIIKEKKK